MKRQLSIILLLFSSNLTYAKNNTDTEKFLQNSFIDSPKRLHITAGLLLEQIRMTGTDVCTLYGITPQTPPLSNPGLGAPLPVIFTNSFENIHFNLDPGLKVGLGYHFEHDNWMGLTNFEWLKSRGRYNQTLVSNSLVSINPSNIGALYYLSGLSPLPVYFQQVSAHLDVSYYLLDVMLSKGSFFSRNFSFTPTGGIKTTWIQYNSYQKFSDDANTDEYAMPSTVFWERTSKVNFWGSGPAGGLDCTFHVALGWSIVSCIDLSILLGERTTTANQGFKNGVDSAIHILNAADSSLILSPTFGAFLGIEYTQPALEDSGHLTLRIGVDGRSYFNQYPTIGSTIYNESINGDVIYPFYNPNLVANNTFGMIGCVIDLTWSF